MKKGFGSTNVGHLFSSYPYQGHPDEDARNIDLKDKLNHKAKIKTAFKGNLHPSTTFTPNYAVYDTQEPYKVTKDDEIYRGKSLGNWKYNNPNKKGDVGAFTSYPKYI